MKALRGAALTLASSVALAFALRAAAEPVGWWWLLVPALAVAIALGTSGSATPVRAGVAFRRAWLFGTCFVFVMLAWLIVPAAAHLGPALFAVAAVFAAIEALPMALAGWAFARTRDGAPFGFCLGVPAAYALLEALRASGPLGLPLATFGTTQTAGPLAVALAIGGVPLVTFLALAVAATAVYLARGAREATISRRAVAATLGLATLAVAGLVVAQVVWHEGLAARDRRPLARVGIVEAGPVDVGRSFAASAADYATATARLPRDIDYALWPEGVLYLTVSDAAAQRREAAAAARALGRPLIVGATHRVRGALHNDVVAVDASGGIATIYTKRRLVPFGEYQPFSLGGPKRANYDAGAATDEPPIRLDGKNPFSAMICYEVAFSDLSRASANTGATYLVAVLNDSWFAASDGPYQLAQLQQARAIESGLAIVRADTVPPSGLVDADGRYVQTELLGEGEAVVAVPAGLVTPFRRAGPWPAGLVLAAIAAATLLRPLTRRRGNDRPEPRRGRSREAVRLRM